MNPVEAICKNKIVAVIRAQEPKEALEKIKVMREAGIKLFEITVEKGKMLPALSCAKELDDTVVMAGGVITAMRAQEAFEHGAQLIVSPVFQTGLAKFCLGSKIAHIATVSTPNEAYSAWKARIPIIKIFPAKPMGRIEYIDAMLRPMPFLKLRR